MSNPQLAANLGTLTNTVAPWRARWVEWALSAEITHGCLLCGWQATGKLEETRAAYLEHVGSCAVAPRNGRRDSRPH
jgi:hypothetical protein